MQRCLLRRQDLRSTFFIVASAPVSVQIALQRQFARTPVPPPTLKALMRRFLVLCLALLLPVAACGDDDGSGPSADVVGTFNLQTINGATVPAVVFQAGADRLEVVSGSITFNENRTFSAALTLREAVGGVANPPETETDTGTYTVSGNTVQLTAADGTTATATISGNTLTSNQQGFTLVYRK